MELIESHPLRQSYATSRGFLRHPAKQGARHNGYLITDFNFGKHLAAHVAPHLNPLPNQSSEDLELS